VYTAWAMRSVAEFQISTTLLRRSSSVMEPSAMSLRHLATRSEASRTTFSLSLGKIMSLTPMEMPARVAVRKPVSFRASSTGTVASPPTFL